MDNKSNGKMTTQKRLKQFQGDFTVLNNRLFCNFCNEEIDYQRNDTVDKHVDSAKHKTNKLQSNKNYFRPQTSLIPSNEENKMMEDLIEFFIESNIPIEKIDGLRKWISKYVLGRSTVPSHESMRQYHFKKYMRKERFEIEEITKEKHMALAIDGTSDRW